MNSCGPPRTSTRTVISPNVAAGLGRKFTEVLCVAARQHSPTFASGRCASLKSEFLISWHLQRVKNSTTSKESLSCWSGRFFPVHTTIELHQKVAKMMDDEIELQPQEFQDCVIFMSMYNDTDWTKRVNRDTCYQKLSRVSEHARHFPEGCWSFLGHRDKNMVGNPPQETKGRMELGRRNGDAKVRQEWSSSLLEHKSFVQRNIDE